MVYECTASKAGAHHIAPLRRLLNMILYNNFDIIIIFIILAFRLKWFAKGDRAEVPKSQPRCGVWRPFGPDIEPQILFIYG